MFVPSKKNRSFQRAFCWVLAIGTLLIGGCTGADTVDASLKPIDLKIHAGANLNQGTHKTPLAQVVKIYHLRSSERFEQAGFESLLDADEQQKILGPDLLDSREVLLVPGQRYESQELLGPETKYLGVVAFFRQPAAHRWRFTYSTKESASTGITVGVHACAMTSTHGALVTRITGAPDSLGLLRCEISR